MKEHEEALKKIAGDKQLLEKQLYQAIGTTVLDWQRETGLRVSFIYVDIEKFKTIDAKNISIANGVSVELDYEGY